MLEGDGEADTTPAGKNYQPVMIWHNIILISSFHALAVYGLWLAICNPNLLTYAWGILLAMLSGIGVTAGAHRLWSHRAYKAKWPLKLILLVFYSIAGQNSVYDWVRDHRLHHKFSETDADPHNARRGFFFAHVGWLMQRKHPDVIKTGQKIIMNDISDDPLVAFHTKYFIPIKLLLCFIIPIAVPVVFWNEALYRSVILIGILRYVVALNFTWIVNSAAHLWGNKPYDKGINPSQNRVVSFLAMGEGWHNYHHVFPWDYKAAEFGNYRLNVTTAFIDFFAMVGWAYDLKTVPSEVVENRVLRTGDGSHTNYASSEYKES